MDPVPMLAVSLGLALLWLSSARHKLKTFDRFKATLADYRLLPERIIGAAAVALVAIELALGTALILPVTRAAALAGSAGLLSIYAAAIGVNLLRGRRHIDCGCMGPADRPTLSAWLVARNVLLALLALTSLQPGPPRALLWLDFVTIAAAVGAFALIYAALNHLIANAPELARLRR